MISEFEVRLSQVLGNRVPAPFLGRVQVAPGVSDATLPRILLGVERTEVLQASLGEPQDMVVPGHADPRRVVRARCFVRLTVEPQDGGGRPVEVLGLDLALYALDAADFRNGSALAGGPPDPGFLIRRMQVNKASSPHASSAEDPPRILAETEGVFWPPGIPGQAGPQILETRIRGILTPVELHGPSASLRAGGAPVEFALRVRPISAPTGGPPLPPFESLALSLVTEAGAPGDGSLAGAVNGVLFVNVTGEAATFRYAPPANATRELLVLSLDDREGGVGLELVRFEIVVGS